MGGWRITGNTRAEVKVCVCLGVDECVSRVLVIPVLCMLYWCVCVWVCCSLLSCPPPSVSLKICALSGMCFALLASFSYSLWHSVLFPQIPSRTNARLKCQWVEKKKKTFVTDILHAHMKKISAAFPLKVADSCEKSLMKSKNWKRWSAGRKAELESATNRAEELSYSVI